MAHSPLTATKYSSNLAWSHPSNASPHSLNHSLQVYFQTCSTMACKFAWSCLRSASPNLHYHELRVHLSVYLITASKCISQLPRSQRSSVSPNLLEYDLQVNSIITSERISKYAPLPLPGKSKNSLDHGLGVFLWLHLIIIFRSIANRYQAPPSASPDIPYVDGQLYRYIAENTN
jgi:hypothetical protein